jgi:hypothetical protein
MNAAVDGDRRLAPTLTVVVATTTMGALAGSFAGGPVLVAAFGLAWGPGPWGHGDTAQPNSAPATPLSTVRCCWPAWWQAACSVSACWTCRYTAGCRPSSRRTSGSSQLDQIRVWVGLSWVRNAVDGLMFVLLLLAMLVPTSVVLGRRQAVEPAASSAPSLPW